MAEGMAPGSIRRHEVGPRGFAGLVVGRCKLRRVRENEPVLVLFRSFRGKTHCDFGVPA